MYRIVAIQPFGCNTTINFTHSYNGVMANKTLSLVAASQPSIVTRRVANQL